MPISIQNVPVLPASLVKSRMGESIVETLPEVAPAKTTKSGGGGGAGNVPYKTDHFDRDGDGRIDAHASYRLVDGKAEATPFSVSLEDGDKRHHYWDTSRDGKVNWQQYSDGSGRGAYFENLMDENKDGATDVLVQGYLGVHSNRFQTRD